MAQYSYYNDYARRHGLWLADCKFSLFASRDVDRYVMRDATVIDWAYQQGHNVIVDEHIWSKSAVFISKYGIDYPHTMVVDSYDSSILMIRDPDLALAFKLKFC